jgi:2-polyprenyl-3-methyl-5-hydroxy-6-metoxy-1,4-benzoquinol methylase
MKQKMKEDEYIWDNYTKEYSQQVKEMEETAGSDFLIKSFNVKNGEIQFTDRLHVNWKEIYQVAFQLSPSSIFECGCGGMYHLMNMRALLPHAKIGGCDLLETQVKFGGDKFNIPNDILNNIKIIDFSKNDAIEGFNKYDFVYCHAVVMHISYDKAVSFLKNMGAISNKYIMLVEGTAKHDYMDIFNDAGLMEGFELSVPNKYIKNGSFLLTKKVEELLA